MTKKAFSPDTGNASKSALSRRGFLTFGLGATAAASASGLVAPVQAQTLFADLRGSIDVSSYGVRPGALDNQSQAFQRAINAAASEGQPIFLPAGVYVVGNIDLPSGLTLVGVPGQSRIQYSGDGHLFFGTGITDVRLQGLAIDGSNRSLADYTPALVHISTGANIAIEDCQITGSLKNGVVFDRVEGRVERCTLSGIMGAAFRSNDAQGLAIRDNVVRDCADNGILVWRWEEGRDGSIITGNRIERIRSVSGGNGQFGNGINVFRASDVMIANNHIHDCDYSALRCNAASNGQMVGNHCSKSGEVAIFAEFGFEGSVISANVVDGAANGISVTNFNDGGRMAIVSNNLVRNLSLESRYNYDEPVFGKGICVEADTTVTSNVVENAPYAGITAGWGPYLRNIMVAQNVVRKARHGVIVSVADGAGSARITGNMFDDTPDGAIVGARWYDIVTGDLVDADPRQVPAGLTLDGNQLIG